MEGNFIQVRILVPSWVLLKVYTILCIQGDLIQRNWIQVNFRIHKNSLRTR